MRPKECFQRQRQSAVSSIWASHSGYRQKGAELRSPGGLQRPGGQGCQGGRPHDAVPGLRPPRYRRGSPGYCEARGAEVSRCHHTVFRRHIRTRASWTWGTSSTETTLRSSTLEHVREHSTERAPHEQPEWGLAQPIPGKWGARVRVTIPLASRARGMSSSGCFGEGYMGPLLFTAGCGQTSPITLLLPAWISKRASRHGDHPARDATRPQGEELAAEEVEGHPASHQEHGAAVRELQRRGKIGWIPQDPWPQLQSVIVV